jgi:hypothetical protein
MSAYIDDTFRAGFTDVFRAYLNVISFGMLGKRKQAISIVQE